MKQDRWESVVKFIRRKEGGYSVVTRRNTKTIGRVWRGRGLDGWGTGPWYWALNGKTWSMGSPFPPAMTRAEALIRLMSEAMNANN